MKLCWHSCSIWDKNGWHNWLWQFLCERLTSFNPKKILVLIGMISQFMWRTSFCMWLISRKPCRFLPKFSTGFISLSVLLLSPLIITFFIFLCVQILILFHLTQMRFSQSIHLQMCLSLETLSSIIKTGFPILVELTDLVNSVVTLPRWLTLLLTLWTVILTVLLFWIYLLLLILVFVLQWLSLH